MNTALVWLDLAQNELGALGGGALGLALKANSTLKQLNIERNELGEAGGYLLAEAVAANSSIVSLNVARNDLGAAGEAFAAVLEVRARSMLHVVGCGRRMPE